MTLDQPATWHREAKRKESRGVQEQVKLPTLLLLLITRKSRYFLI